MTRAEFIAEYHPRPTDDVRECHCGSCDCPGWKIVDREREKMIADALDRLPQVMMEAAYRAGRQMGERLERRVLEAIGVLPTEPVADEPTVVEAK